MRRGYRLRALYAARQEWNIRPWEPETGAEAKEAVAGFIGSILLHWHKEKKELGL